MANTTYSSHQLVARLYLNPRFGKTVGPNRVNRSVYNASIELPDKNAKLFVDLAGVADIGQTTSSTQFDHMAAVLVAIANRMIGVGSIDDIVAGQLKFVTPDTDYVDGGVLLNTRTLRLHVMLFENGDVRIDEQLQLHQCKVQTAAKRSPDLYGTTTPAAPAAPKVSAVSAKILSQLGLN